MFTIHLCWSYFYAACSWALIPLSLYMKHSPPVSEIRKSMFQKVNGKFFLTPFPDKISHFVRQNFLLPFYFPPFWCLIFLCFPVSPYLQIFLHYIFFPPKKFTFPSPLN